MDNVVLTVQDIQKVSWIRHLHQVSLKTIAEYYEQCLIPYDFEYSLRDGGKIYLKFERGQFAHLMGLHKIQKKLAGISCWESIVTGEISFHDLFLWNKPEFRFIESRFKYIPSLIEVLRSPYLCLYDSSKVEIKGIPKLDCELLFYDELNQKYILLGIEKLKSKEKYFAKSFFVRNDDVYTNKQEPIAITGTKITNRYNGECLFLAGNID